MKSPMIYRCFCDGQYIGTKLASDITYDELIQMMVGRTITNIFPKEEAEIGEVYLKVEGLSRNNEFHDVSFEVRRGEIFGLAGLMGAGRTEVVETLFAFEKSLRVKFMWWKNEAQVKSPSDAIRYGFCLLTEDRKQSGAFYR